MGDNLTTKTISGLIWKFGERISAQLISFIVSVVLARILLPEQYGTVAIVMIFITLANSLITSGMGTALVQKKDSDSKDFSTLFWASLSMSFFLYVVLFFLSPVIANFYSDDSLVLILRVMGIMLPISSIKSIQHAYVSKNMIFKKFFISTLFGTIISGIVGISMAYCGLGVWALVAQYLINCFVDTLVLFFTVKWHPNLVFSIKRFKELFSYGWKIMAAGFIGTVFNEIKSLAVGYKYSTVDLAYYNKGEHIPNLVINNVNDAIESVTFPAFSQIQDDTEKMKMKTKEMIRASNLILMPILFGIAAIAEPLTIILFTEKWIAIVPFIQLACIAKMFSVVTTLNLQAVKAKGNSDVLLKLEFIKKPVYLMFILVGIFISPLAVAIANTIYSFVAIIINTAPNKKYLNYSFLEQLTDIFPSLLISIIMFAVVCSFGLLLNLNIYIELVLSIALGAVVYIILIFVFQKAEIKKTAEIIKVYLGRKGN